MNSMFSDIWPTIVMSFQPPPNHHPSILGPLHHSDLLQGPHLWVPTITPFGPILVLQVVKKTDAFVLSVGVERISAPPLKCSTDICRENSSEIVLHYNGAPLQCSTTSPEFSLQISVLHFNGGADIRSTPICLIHKNFSPSFLRHHQYLQWHQQSDKQLHLFLHGGHGRQRLPPSTTRLFCAFMDEDWSENFRLN